MAQPALSATPLLRAEAISKGFGGVPVLCSVSLALEPGTVTALAGENGAGKSTLMKIIAGQYAADEGQVFVDGQVVTHGVSGAQRAGIAIVPQELASIPDLTVYENLFVGREIRSRIGGLNRSAMIKKSREMLAEFGVDIDPQAVMRSLPVGLQQIVEIVKNSSRGARVLLLDEPTSAIAEREVERLYDVVRRLRSQGVAMIYTTHKMGEIRAIADRVVILRDGDLVTDEAIGAITDDSIVSAMIGRDLEQLFPDRNVPTDDPVLVVDNLLVEGASGPVSLTVRAGEILSLSGLVGAGRTELIEALFGLRRVISGSAAVNGRQLTSPAPSGRIAQGLALVPEDRKGSGTVLSMSILDNGSMPRLAARYTRSGMLLNGRRAKEVGAAMKSVRLRSQGLGQDVGNLSGGNQQKVVLARWLTDKVEVLLLDEPTRGVDVGARSEIYRIILDLASQGMAVLMASSDMAEVLGLSHRSLVMREGVVVGELSLADLGRDDAQERIFRMGSGQERSALTDTPTADSSAEEGPA